MLVGVLFQDEVAFRVKRFTPVNIQSRYDQWI